MTTPESLDDVADKLDQIAAQLRGLLNSYSWVAPGDFRTDAAALKRIRVSRSRLATMLDAIGSTPDFVIDGLAALVSERLMLDEDRHEAIPAQSTPPPH